MNETNSNPAPATTVPGVSAGSPAAPSAPAVPPAAKPAAPAAVPTARPAGAPPAPAAPAAPPPPPPPVPAALAGIGLPFQGTDYSFKGYHADATVEPDQVVAAASKMDKEGFSLDTITGVDWLAQSQMEVVYDFFHPHKNLRVVIRARVPRDRAEVPTISAVFPGANWHERETHDFFGINFLGHPDLTPFLLPEDADYHPLRKDFAL